MTDPRMHRVIASGETLHYPLRLKRNRHRATSGRDWGWIEDSRGRSIAFWEGDEERLQAATLIRDNDPTRTPEAHD